MQVPLNSTRVTLATFPFCFQYSTLGQAAVSAAILPYSYLCKDVPAERSCGYGVLSPSQPQSWHLEWFRWAAKMMPGEEGLLQRSIPLFLHLDDLMLPYSDTARHDAVAWAQRFHILVPVTVIWLASEGKEISLGFPSPCSLVCGWQQVPAATELPGWVLCEPLLLVELPW